MIKKMHPDLPSKDFPEEIENTSSPVSPAAEEKVQKTLTAEETLQPDEYFCLDLLNQATQHFSSMEQTHPHDMTEWIISMQRLQSIISQRVLRRIIPSVWVTMKNPKNA